MPLHSYLHIRKNNVCQKYNLPHNSRFKLLEDTGQNELWPSSDDEVLIYWEEGKMSAKQGRVAAQVHSRFLVCTSTQL
jgi:hypothetical protein